MIDASSDWVRLTAPVKARVAVYRDGKWVATDGKTLLPAGWYAGPGAKK